MKLIIGGIARIMGWIQLFHVTTDERYFGIWAGRWGFSYHTYTWNGYHTVLHVGPIQVTWGDA